MPLPRDIIYLPILAVRPSEMAALHELPEKDKDLLLPAIQLQPWLSAKEFEKAIDRVVSAFGSNRPWIANLNQEYTGPKSGADRLAIDDFYKLRLPKGGYANWCAFIEDHRQLIPTVQMEDISQFETQSTRLAGFGRGLVLHLSANTTLADAQLSHLASVCDPANVIVIADCGELANRLEFNLVINEWSGVFDRISKHLPSCRIALSSTSFPHSFDGGEVNQQIRLLSQDIRERQLFNVAAASAPARPRGITPWNLIYSDRGSVRIARHGGGGSPYPRIDYPTNSQWYSFRYEVRDGDYQQVAKAAIGSPCWNKNLRLWGTQMIERTAGGDETAISSPGRSTAVRINIHLHQQLFYSQPDDLLATDDVWVD